MPRYDFSGYEALRTSIGEPRPRTLPEMVDLALAAADYDAEIVETHIGPPQLSARELVGDVIGFNLNDRIREVLELVDYVPQGDEPICAWCNKAIRAGLATVRHPVGGGVDVYHASCWDQYLVRDE